MFSNFFQTLIISTDENTVSPLLQTKYSMLMGNTLFAYFAQSSMKSYYSCLMDPLPLLRYCDRPSQSTILSNFNIAHYYLSEVPDLMILYASMTKGHRNIERDAILLSKVALPWQVP